MLVYYWNNFTICLIVRYKQAYALSISALGSKYEWWRKGRGYTMGPPNSLRPRGRPKKKRFQSDGEKGPTGLRTRTHKCTRCGILGHHKNACKEPLNGGNADISGSTAEVAERYAYNPYCRLVNC